MKTLNRRQSLDIQAVQTDLFPSAKQHTLAAFRLPSLSAPWLAVIGLGALLAPLGCRQQQPASTPATIIDTNTQPDPALANLAPVDSNAYPVQQSAPGKQPVRVLGQQAQYTPQQSETYSAQQQPLGGQAVPPPPSDQQTAYDNQNNGYDADVNAGYQAVEEAYQPPPPLPEYEQPPAPEPNDLWTPGYWNYASAGYFWVPGAWVAAPYPGALWTPGYWGAYGPNRYRFHHGFWARHIGFYGGINYGYGYVGSGYEGGYWRGNDFFYNRAVNRVNVVNIHNVYERNITVNNITRVSYNGGNGGLQVRPRPQELAVLREQRLPPMAPQLQLRQEAAANRQQFFNENHGRPAIPVAARPIPAERGIMAPQGPSQQQPFVRTQQVDQARALQMQQQHLAQDQARAQQQQRLSQEQARNLNQIRNENQVRNQEQLRNQDQLRNQQAERANTLQQQQQQRVQEVDRQRDLQQENQQRAAQQQQMQQRREQDQVQQQQQQQRLQEMNQRNLTSQPNQRTLPQQQPQQPRPFPDQQRLQPGQQQQQQPRSFQDQQRLSQPGQSNSIGRQRINEAAPPAAQPRPVDAQPRTPPPVSQHREAPSAPLVQPQRAAPAAPPQAPRAQPAAPAHETHPR